jgi:lysophospholipase L1-like esterase
MHLALVGDSTLDNGAYTAGGPSVVECLQDLLPADDEATLLAVDGATTGSIPHQVRQLPPTATHVVLSVGGNDALQNIGTLESPAETVAGALRELSRVVDRFETAYRECLQEVLAAGLPTIACTIYNGSFQDQKGTQTVIDAALTMWNDAIVQAALDHGLSVLDLRRVCTEPADFTQQIEPNEQGGRKIAEALYRAHVNPSMSALGPAGNGDLP